MSFKAHVNGRVKTYQPERHFATVAPDDGSPDIFVFAKIIGDRELKLAHRVELADVILTDRGWVATRIIRVWRDLSDWRPATGKWFHINKGYGFVTTDDTREDAFVHMEVLRPLLAAGLVVDRFTGMRLEVATYPGKEGRPCVGEMRMPIGDVK